MASLPNKLPHAADLERFNACRQSLLSQWAALVGGKAVTEEQASAEIEATHAALTGILRLTGGTP